MPARLGVVLTVLFWGSQFPLMHDLAQRWDVYTVNVIRYPAAALSLLLLARLIGSGPIWPSWVGWGKRALLGAAVACFAVVFTLALAIGDPVTTAVIAALAPATSSLVAWLVDRVRPGASVLFGLALVVPGAALAAVDLNNGWDAEAGRASLLAAGLIVIGQVCWAWYSLMAQRWLRGLSQLAITGCSLAWAVPYLIAAFAVATLAEATRAGWSVQPAEDALTFAILTFGALVGGVALWNQAVARLGLPVTALYVNLIPVTAIAIAYGYGIVPRPEQLAGAVLVIAGVVVGQSGGWRRKS